MEYSKSRQSIELEHNRIKFDNVLIFNSHKPLKHEIFNLSYNGTKLFGQIWLPSQPKAAICLIHGQGEHSSRYKHVGHFFAEKGWALIAIDLIGHGQSEGERGHINGMKDYFENVSLLVKEAKARFENCPIFIYGHSMGGNVVANYALSPYFDKDIKAIVLTSPWLKLAFEPPKFKVMLASMMKFVYPSFTEENSLDGVGLSRNQDVGKAYLEDPLVHGYITAGAFFALHEAGLFALKNAHAMPKPTLLMHGTGDTITSHLASKDFVHANSTITHKEWEGYFHELHNEIGWEEVMEFVIDWLNQQLES